MKRHYTAQDLENSRARPYLDFIKAFPHLFLEPQVPLDRILCSKLSYQLILLSNQTITLHQHDGWWIVASKDDWLLEFDDSVFYNHFPLPGIRNSLRVEALLMAYSIDLVSVSPYQTKVLKGELPDWDIKELCSAILPGWRRSLVFRASQDMLPIEESPT